MSTKQARNKIFQFQKIIVFCEKDLTANLFYQTTNLFQAIQISRLSTKLARNKK